jgi:hypothetical protein
MTPEKAPAAAPGAATTQEAGLLDQILDNTRAQTPEERGRNREYIDQFIRRSSSRTR